MAACYSGLYRNVADEEGEHFVLDGAESVDVSEDGTVYTFHLRQDAKWSDGEPVTAHDYEYGWKRLLDPQYGYDYASFVFNIVGAEEYNSGSGSVDDVKAVALDDYTFEVTLKQADPTFEAKLVSTPLYPTREDIAEAAGDKKGIRRYGNFLLPMDETLVLSAVDLSGRPYLVCDLPFTVEKVGGFDTEMVREFFYAVSYSAAMNLHLKLMHGVNNHHIMEAAFKAFAKALDEAVSYDSRITDVLSTKGSL